MISDAENEPNLNTDRLVSDIRGLNDQDGPKKGKNFNSRKIQKSDDFKVTFAYTSKNQSVDLDQ